MNLINTDAQLVDFCKILEKQPFITVDSEFIREHSYYPKLCLLQVGYDGDAAIIDPLANVDLTPFFEILQNPDIVKVFHAGRQDIEIFYNLDGHVPQNVFDTQIAAMVCGFAENIGYGNLVHEILHIDLDKSRRLTDWSLRPLDEAQLEYALGDVTHLVGCYKYLKKYMEEHQRTDWINEETACLCDTGCYDIKCDEVWHKIKHNAHSPQFLAALKYNLDFSWFIANFPSSSFPQCGKTYSCTRIACLVPQPGSSAENPLSQKLSCVFKRNQTYFLGAQVTCQNKNTRSAK